MGCSAHGRETVRMLDVPYTLHQQEPRPPARADPHGREAVQLLGVPPAVQQQGRRCSARADPHGQKSTRLLDVPPAVQRQERRSPARADPHGREAMKLLDVPAAVRPQGRRSPARVEPHRLAKVGMGARSATCCPREVTTPADTKAPSTGEPCSHACPASLPESSRPFAGRMRNQHPVPPSISGSV